VGDRATSTSIDKYIIQIIICFRIFVLYYDLIRLF